MDQTRPVVELRKARSCVLVLLCSEYLHLSPTPTARIGTCIPPRWCYGQVFAMHRIETALEKTTSALLRLFEVLQKCAEDWF